MKHSIALFVIVATTALLQILAEEIPKRELQTLGSHNEEHYYSENAFVITVAKEGEENYLAAQGK